jgi:hypothetical protein
MIDSANTNRHVWTIADMATKGTRFAHLLPTSDVEQSICYGHQQVSRGVGFVLGSV